MPFFNKKLQIPMVTASQKDMAEISSILMSSFEDNKSMTYLVPKGSCRVKRFSRFIGYSMTSCLDFGKVVFSDDRKACALVLFPDLNRFTFSELWRDLGLVRVIGISSALRAMKRGKLVKDRHPDEQLYYLWFIGVSPEDQGKGFGTALMLELMADARTLGRTMVLETSTLRNIPWYHKLGFQTYNEINLGYTLYFLKN